MPRDYAHRNSGARRQTRNKNQGSLPGWIWMALGLSLGLAVAAFVYIRRPVESPLMRQADATTASVDTRAPASERRKPGKSEALALPPKEKERFTFYDTLKHQEVALPSDAAKSQQPPAGAA